MLVDDMRKALLNARKDKDTSLIQVHTSVLAKIMIAEKSGNHQIPLSDEIVQTLIQKEIKELEETVSFLQQNNPKRELLLSQIEYLKLYLPQPYTDLEVESMIIGYLAATEETNKGKVIGTIVKMVGNRFDKSKIKGMVDRICQ